MSNPTDHINWTCPAIDRVKTFIDQVEYLGRGVDEVHKELERLRSDNKDLREVAEKLQDEIDEKEEKIRELTYELEGLKE